VAGSRPEAVERETGNEIAVEIFDRGKLHIDDKLLPAVRSGKIETAVVGQNQISKLVQAASLMEQPVLTHASIRASVRVPGRRAAGHASKLAARRHRR
jgi:TRAP-type C4-dicarboxylate transport system substrate-binding protein